MRGDVASLRLTGELDIAGLDWAQAELTVLLESAPRALVIDLSGLEFMDSSGLRYVLAADRDARAGGAAVLVVHGSVAVQRLFRLTQSDRHLRMIDGYDAALRSVAPAAG